MGIFNCLGWRLLGGDNRLPSFACEVTLRPRLRKVGLYNNIVRDNIVRNNIIARDQKEIVSVAGQMNVHNLLVEACL